LSRSQRIPLAGLDLIPDLSGALYVPDYRALLVADLHLEKGSSLARRGVHLPPYDTRASLAQLGAAIAAVRPERLIFLGDSFHDDDARGRIDEADLAQLRAITADHATVWISGNHDPAPPQDVGGAVTEEVALGPLTLRHAPQPLAAGEFEISGHLHPGAAVAQRGRLIRCRCFVADRHRLIMPAFGSYTGALSVSSPAFAGLFAEFEVWMIGSSAIHRLAGHRVR
jgi:DNA ligase-associated metallophosphoesterase